MLMVFPLVFSAGFDSLNQHQADCFPRKGLDDATLFRVAHAFEQAVSLRHANGRFLDDKKSAGKGAM